MKQHPFISVLFPILIMVGGSTLALAETTSTTTVEFSSVIHFLNPVGDDIEVGPGIYEVEAAESWLKLVPEGQRRTESVLLETTQGTHEETLSDPAVRLVGEPDNPDVFHLAMLLQDATGLEAVGTISGIRPRGLNLAIVVKRNQNSIRLGNASSAQRGSPPMVSSRPPGPSSKSNVQVLLSKPLTATSNEVDCGPYLYMAGGGMDGGHSPTIVVFENRLHIVYPTGNRRLFQWTFIKNENRWGVANLEARKSLHGKLSKAQVALAIFQDRLHMVHIGKSSNDLYHSYFNGKEWSPDIRIPDQKSKATPALAVHKGELHMLHLGDSSNDLWHSVYRGKGWTINTKIGQKSGHSPALAVWGSQLRMISTHVQPSFGGGPKHLYNSWFDGKRWHNNGKIPGQLAKTTPAVVTVGDMIHHIHLGKTSNDLWYSMWGPPNPLTNPWKPEWRKEEKIPGLSSDSPPSVVFHDGCMHMAFQKGKSIMHATFPPRMP